MNTKKSFSIGVIVIFALNIGLYTWNAKLENDLRPSTPEYLKDIPKYSLDSIAFDSENRMWIVGRFGVKEYDEGLLINDFSSVEIVPKNFSQFQGSNVQIYIDQLDRPWVVAHINLLILQNGNWSSYDLRDLGIQVGSYGNNVSDVAFDLQNRAWIVADKSVIIFDPNKNNVDHFGAVEVERSGVSDISVDWNGKIWLSTWGSGILIVDGAQREIFTQANSPLTSDTVYSVRFDSENRAWIATAQGFNVFDGKEWKTYTPENTRLLSEQVTYVEPTSSGRIWLGNHGLAVDKNKWGTYFVPHTWFSNTWSNQAFDQIGNMWVFDGPYNMIPNGTSDYALAFVPVTTRLASPLDMFINVAVQTGGMIFLSIFIVEVWLAFLANSNRSLWISIVPSLLLGVYHFVYWIHLGQDHISFYPMQSIPQIFFLGNPGFILAIIILTASLTYKAIGRTTNENKGLIIGWLVGLPLSIGLWLLAFISLIGP